MSIFYSSDKDECIGNNHNCDPNSTCQNTEGSYKCICNEGYTADGHTCQGRRFNFSVYSGVATRCVESVINEVGTEIRMAE